MSLRQRCIRALLAAGAVGLAGCAFGPAGPAPDGELQRFARRGYEAVTQTTAEPWREGWLHGDTEVAIELLVPQSGGQVPLIVYLPGMGETVDAGERWRQAWAAAGYAVLSLQTARDAALWSSRASRNADFQRMAREEFKPATLPRRLATARFAIDAVAQRAAAGVQPFARIDASRVAVAGFDLGAQTALGLAGERHPAVTLPDPPKELRAVILLSPYVNPAEGALGRYLNIGVPVLAVTGTADVDPYGLRDAAPLRRALHQHLPPGEKYLLVLNAGNHQMLSGNKRLRESARGGDDARPEDDQSGQRQSSGGRGGGPGRGGSGRGGGPGDGGGMGGPGGMRGGGQDGRAGPGGLPGARGGASDARQAVVIERVSVAFLDASLKADTIAREWLARDAGRWMDGLASLASN